MKKILLVDDKPENTYLLEKLFQGHGYETLSAANGAEALAMARRDTPSLIVTDILMPVMDGFALCRQWKNDAVLRRIPFIFYTATYTDPRDEEFSLALGADRFIVKPLEPEAFLAIVEDTLDLFTIGSVAQATALPETDDIDYLRRHNDTLSRKLARKIAQADEAKQKIRHYTAELEKRIEELKHAAEKISEQARLLDIAHDAIMVRDMNDTLLYFNKAAERLYGWTFEEMRALKIREYISDKDTKVFEEGKKLSIETGEWEGELQQFTKDGRKRFIQTRWSLVRDKNGAPTARLIINRDMTEQRALEAQFRRTQRLESLGTLAGGIAHDLNNVLAPILMATEIMDRRIEDPQMKKMVAALRSSARRGSDIVKQVLAFARGSEQEFSPQQLRYIVKEIEAIIKETFPKTITLSMNLPNDIHPVLGDATQILQVLMNLCVNARDAMPKGGDLRITVTNFSIDETFARMKASAKPGDYVLLCIADSGIGIPKDLQEKIFEPFFTTKEIGRGTGLGLSTVFTIVKDHKGFIDLYSEVGKGTEFKIYLPALFRKETAESPLEKIPIPMGNGEMILVVDDELTILQITRETLETYGYQVQTAVDGAEATAMFAAAPKDSIQLVLIDINMPVMDGPTCVKALRHINPEIKIILSSGVLTEIDSVKLAMLDIQGYITKPYTAEKMLCTMRDVLASVKNK